MKIITSSERLYTKNGWNQQDQDDWFNQNSLLKGSQKGDHLEELVREFLEDHGICITLSKARKWLSSDNIMNDTDNYALQIFGDNGIDLFGYTKINFVNCPIVIQCKCYDTIEKLSSTDALALDALTEHFGKNAIGIFIVKNDNSVNDHFKNAIKNSNNRINWFSVRNLPEIITWLCNCSIPNQVTKEITIEEAHNVQEIAGISIKAEHLKNIHIKEYL